MRHEQVKIPRAWCEANKNVILTADVTLVAGVLFLITYSQTIKFGTVEFLPRQLPADLTNSLKKVLNLYARGGFNVRTCMMDMAFKPVKELLPQVEVNTMAAQEHVTEAE